jgi:CheY-like chemotaxis protein
MAKCNLLIVDDDADDQEMLTKAYFRIGGTYIKSAYSVDEAFNFMCYIQDPADFPKVILSDMQMPKYSGYDLLHIFKGTPAFSQIPVIIWSTSDNAVEMAKCFSVGARDFLIKPPTLEGFFSIAYMLRSISCEKISVL